MPSELPCRLVLFDIKN
jgi:hypothetical protein